MNIREEHINSERGELAFERFAEGHSFSFEESVYFTPSQNFNKDSHAKQYTECSIGCGYEPTKQEAIESMKEAKRVFAFLKKMGNNFTYL